METSMSNDGQFAQVMQALGKRMENARDDGGALAALGSRVALEVFATRSGPLAPAFPGALHGGQERAPSGPPIVRAFWWGFHIEASSQGLSDFAASADPVAAIIAAIGPVTGPAAPWIALAAAFFAGALALLKSLDRGKGVYISMSWFAPGVFVPTTVT